MALALFVYIGVMTPLLPRLIEEQLGGDEIDIGLNLAAFSIAAVLHPARAAAGSANGASTMSDGLGCLLAAADGLRAS